MIHPHTELKFINKEIGFGVFATELIPKGTIVWALDKLDRTFTTEQINAFEQQYRDILEKYCYRDQNGNFVLCWDISRFVNHSFNSSLISTPYNFELAARDILPGEEITDDYGYLNILEPMICAPENGSTRTVVYPDDILHLHKEWDAKMESAFLKLADVDQSLFSFLDTETQIKALSIAKGEQKTDSILTCYYQEVDKREKFNL